MKIIFKKSSRFTVLFNDIYNFQYHHAIHMDHYKTSRFQYIIKCLVFVVHFKRHVLQIIYKWIIDDSWPMIESITFSTVLYILNSSYFSQISVLNFYIFIIYRAARNFFNQGIYKLGRAFIMNSIFCALVFDLFQHFI